MITNIFVVLGFTLSALVDLESGCVMTHDDNLLNKLDVPEVVAPPNRIMIVYYGIEFLK